MHYFSVWDYLWLRLEGLSNRLEVRPLRRYPRVHSQIQSHFGLGFCCRD